MVLNYKNILKYLAVFIAGFVACWFFYPRTVTVPEYKNKEITGEAKATTKTEIVYVPKTVYVDTAGNQVIEKTDLQIDIPKTELNVKINGKEAVISKTDSEQYLFEKNKIALQQTSKAEVNIKVPVVDKTKHWEIGIGYSKKGVVGLVGFPVKQNISGWVAGRPGDVIGGITIKL